MESLSHVIEYDQRKSIFFVSNYMIMFYMQGIVLVGVLFV